MRIRHHSWQLVLFVGAILVPSIALVALSYKIVQQGRELTDKRRMDEQRATLDRIARELLARIEPAARAASREPERPPASPVVLVAPLRDGRLVLPWESDPAVRRFHEQISRPDFREKLSQGEREEFAAGHPDRALPFYREALAAAAYPAAAAHARLLLGRVLDKLRHRQEALAEFRAVLSTPPGLVDEDGVPLLVHAAEQLIESSADRARAVAAVRAALEERAWPSPVARYTLSNFAAQAASADEAAAAGLAESVQARFRQSEQAEALQNDAARLNLLEMKPGGRRAWLLYGQIPWLVSAVPGGTPTVVAIDAREVLQPFEARGDLRFLLAQEPGGETLGGAFPGLRAAFVTRDDAALSARQTLQTRLYWAALLLLLGANVFGAYLLWRSLHREMQLADIRSQFVSSVSHELKTPLTAIRMYAETLQMGRSRDPAMAEEYLDTIVSECGRLSRLVDNVLLFSKIEQGKKVYRFRPVTLSDAVSAAARTLSYPLAQHGFDLRVSLDEDLPPVRADRDSLEQAVLNLLSNAMKYSGESRQIDLRLSRQNGDALIQVVDYGLGIEPEEQARIFEKYYRAPSRENQSIPGTGLGLALVSQIVRAHGGRVAVESTPGKGSTFTIRLPIGAGNGA